MNIEANIAISVISIVTAIVGSYVTVKANMENQGRNLENVRENISKLDEKINKHSEVLVALEKNSMSAKEAHDMFVSKELFRQMEKHIDARFDGIDTNLGKILEYLNKGKI